MAESTSLPTSPGGKPTVMLFYHLQNERGEHAGHPNAVMLAPANASAVTLADVLAAFPLAGTGSFHFRFQILVPSDVPGAAAGAKTPAYVDVINPGDAVPMSGANVIAKVLRLGACGGRRCVAAARLPR